MSDLPSGTVTFLFTDIEDSTKLLIDLGQETFVRCLTEHDALIRGAIAKAGGVVVKPEGGAFFAVFSTAPAAITAVVEAQSLLQNHVWPEGADIRVRMGLHTGTGTIGGDDYIGIDVHRAARIAAAGFGGQVLLSASTAAIVGPNLPEGVRIENLGEHRLKDLDAEPLYQLAVVGLTSQFPPLEALRTRPTNLPLMPTTFVGRNEELIDVQGLIRGARLVTVTGVAGAGKTRLALEVAATLSNEFSDGAWFVDLSTVTDADSVATETAYALGIRERQGTAARDTLLEYLSQREALLVIDNCEHLISAAAEFVNALLSVAPECRVIATSRELLRVGGEVAYRLRSMSLPEDVSNLDPLKLGRYDAVRLFVERATGVDPDFSITTDTAPAIAEICMRLDGMPLAIELAAAQLRSFTPQQIADHLDQRFQTLTGGLRTAVPRQQTLAAAIDWSYQLLEDRERVVFERLSVFQGGFDLEAAQYVCSGYGIDAFGVFNLVSALADKSLIVADVGGDVARYHVLEMLRQFAGDRLEVAAATSMVQRRHAEYFVTLAEEAEPNLRGESEKEWRDRIDLDLDNLGLAMEWSLDAGEPELGMRLAGAIWRFWKVTFRFSAGVQWLGRMFEAGPDVDKIVRAKVMVGLGTLMTYTDDPTSAGPLLEGAIDIYRELDAQGTDPVILRRGYPSAVISLATNIWQHDQDFDRATELWSEALEIAHRTGDDVGASLALGNLAEAAARVGDVERARVGYGESIEASYALNSTHRTVEAITLSAVFEMSVDEPARAILLLDDAIDLARSRDLPFWDDFGLAMRALATHDLGQPGSRERFMDHSAKLFADDEFRATYYYQLPLVLGRADLEFGAGHPDRAAMLLGVLEAFEEENSPMEPIFEGTRRSRLLEALESELRVQGFADARARGRALSRSDAIDLTANP
jgi:predicted ATPase/class 3 adenylate cyclase